MGIKFLMLNKLFHCGGNSISIFIAEFSYSTYSKFRLNKAME